MKIAAFIRISPESTYLVNKINRSFKVEHAICERMPSWRDRIRKKYIENGLGDVIGLGFALLKNKLKRKKKVLIYSRHFDNLWQEMDDNVKKESVNNINDKETKAILDKHKPDVIIIRGTSLINQDTIESVPLVLNIHAGLSPYYRGTNCSKWALINWDPYNVGVTIHKVSPKIDGGDILGQVRIKIEDSDNVDAIEAKICYHGTELLICALSAFMKEERINFIKQENLSNGFLTLQRQWSTYCEKQINHIDKNGIISKMLKSPSRGPLPIIKYPE